MNPIRITFFYQYEENLNIRPVYQNVEDPNNSLSLLWCKSNKVHQAKTYKK